MILNGKVIKVFGHNMQVEVSCNSGACEHCGACSNKTKILNIVSEKKITENDNVQVELNESYNKISVFLIMVMPIIISILCAIVCSIFLKEIFVIVATIICFLIFMFCGILISTKIIKKASIKIISIMGE